MCVCAINPDSHAIDSGPSLHDKTVEVGCTNPFLNSLHMFTVCVPFLAYVVRVRTNIHVYGAVSRVGRSIHAYSN
jgi:hypothetical protein